jgi:hypothetical protein
MLNKIYRGCLLFFMAWSVAMKAMIMRAHTPLEVQCRFVALSSSEGEERSLKLRRLLFKGAVRCAKREEITKLTRVTECKPCEQAWNGRSDENQ